MKKLSVLALVLAFTMMLSVVSFAADETFSFKTDISEERPADNAENTTVTTAANTDSFTVSTATADGNYYGILLVEGDAVPTVENAILYIDQLTAESTVEDFIVKPIVPTAGKKLTLYVSSNSGAGLVKIPMVYSSDYVAPTYTLGDVVADGKIDISDVTAVLNAYLGNTALDATQNLAADVVVDGKIDISDVTLVLNVYLGNAKL